MEKKAVGDEESYTGLASNRDDSGEQSECDGIGPSPSRVYGGIPSPRIGTRPCEPPDSRPVPFRSRLHLLLASSPLAAVFNPPLGTQGLSNYINEAAGLVHK